MSGILGIIPARFGSTRFPGKALAEINGKSMVQRTYEQAKKCPHLDDVVVATDDERIIDCVEGFGGKACMTSSAHVSGTDRCFEALTKQLKNFNYVVNIQGDEPFINPKQISQLTELLKNDTQLATLVKPITTSSDIFNPNVVKAIFNIHQEAIYFSRHPVPYGRGLEQDQWLSNHTYHKHIGMYGYRSDVLKEITQLNASSLEKMESLEQLRWIESGYKIKVGITEYDSIGIDTPEDLNAALKLFG